jgi:rhamnogalacturonan endolyase
VLVQNCDIDCNDDDFCLKAGRDWDGQRVNRPTEYVVIRKCIARKGGGLLTIGSETAGSIRHVLATDLTAKGTGNGFHIKSATTRGGTVEDIHIRNFTMDSVGNAILFTMNWNPAYSYSALPAGYNADSVPAHWKTLLHKVEPPEKGIPHFKDIYISGIKAINAKKAISAVGLDQSLITGVHIKDLTISAITAGEISYAKDWDFSGAGITARDNTKVQIQHSENVAAPGASAQRQMEWLGRGVVAIQENKNKVFISWRLLGNDPQDIAFNIYRKTGDKTVQLNKEPLTKGTNWVDETTTDQQANTYFVRSILHGKEGEMSRSFTLPPNSPPYLSIPLQTPPGYTPNDVSVGDLDGDGEYEIILHQAGRGKDNSQGGYTDPPIIQAYKMDGTLLWQINLGKNIREGAHYTQFMVYDLDGDGKAEVAMKTADGAIDGKGKVIGDSSKDYRNKDGRILDGPEYFTIFDGLTGAALATTPYIPARGDVSAWGGKGGNGHNDSYGNRVDRFLACIAYLDGVHPSVVMCRGYYGRTVLAAWDWRGGKLTSRWVFDTQNGDNPFSGMGNHNLCVADVDGDGKDEIIYGSMCVDDNGKGLYTTGLRHGDAVHVSVLDPSLPGQQVWGIHEIEDETKGPGTAFFDAATGKILWTGDMDKDVGRGLAADIDPRYPGCECWGGSEGLKTCKGERIGNSPRSVNFRIWWDGDLLAELLDGTHIDKWDYNGGKLDRIFDAAPYNCASNNGTKATPALAADLFGDWREEVIFRTLDAKELRIFSTTIPTDHRIYTLMHDPQYRLGIAWQNVAYNQPAYTSFFLGDGMKDPPRPNITVIHSQNQTK